MLGNLVLSHWMPWKGKRFHAAAQGGDNIFLANGQLLGRLIWPLYNGYRPYRPGRVTAFPFQTYIGPGIKDPEIMTLKLDYDNAPNPRFVIRAVLDELVQLTGNYYLGKAYLRLPTGHYHLAAFFTLRRES
jgi:hypothetical protein